ncbi:MAG: MBOAT family protein [Magnetococcales bacterium]|nr:MBOAT family protein [Magnetococcales bacterium]
MQFTSYSFLIFMTLFLLAWNRVPRWRITLVNGASLLFYGAWNPYYLLLMIGSAMIDYYGALAIARYRQQGGRLLALALTGNLGILIFFKYFYFLNTLWCDLATLLNAGCQPITSSFLLPVGISFYTFQSMAYSIDVYRREMEPSRNIHEYFCYISFFPQLVAGPIERASHLIPQIQKFARSEKIPLEWRESGSLILRGLLKKVVVADNLAVFSDPVFADMNGYSLTTIMIATFFFSIQIYCDFSGYTDIARGLARMIGVRLMENFNHPYSATSMRDFWRRWHISLSTWLRDYLYVALGGSRFGTLRTLSSLMATMLLGGIWHGASYNFLLWGGYHGLLLSFERLGFRLLPFRWPVTLRWLTTLIYIGFGWFLFRIESIDDLGVLAWKIRTLLWGGGFTLVPNLLTLFALFFFLSISLWEKKIRHGKRIMPLAEMGRKQQLALLAGIACIYYFTAPAMDRMFIYFQF